MTSFQRLLLSDIRPGVWYDLHLNQGTGGEPLPDWFYRQQTDPWATVGTMVRDGVLRIRKVEMGLVQVSIREPK